LIPARIFLKSYQIVRKLRLAWKCCVIGWIHFDCWHKQQNFNAEKLSQWFKGIY